MRTLSIAVLGNPNCGKTTLFNALTGARQTVGNWPGVTVDKVEGEFTFGQSKVTVIDLPGTYSLSGMGESSLDEKIARDFVLSHQSDLVVNVIDASNLERNLYLTMQLIEMQVPVIVALNMMDVAKERGISIDAQKFSEVLGCPVVPIIATQSSGVNVLKECIVSSDPASIIPKPLRYSPEIEQSIEKIHRITGKISRDRHINERWLAIKLIEGDESEIARLSKVCDLYLDNVHRDIEEATHEEADILIADSRYGNAHDLVQATTTRSKSETALTWSDKVDKVVLNRYLGLPIFLVVMYLMFMFTINIASAFIDFFDIAVGTLAVEAPKAFLTSISAPDWLIVLLADGVGAGIQTVATFIPVIGFLFLFLTFLEDSGYMSRAAFVMDRATRLIGLPGKAFVPMILGFGCTVPAVMAARTLENRKDRIMTAMMSPFMSCGARLPVYALFAAAFFPVGGQNIVFLLYLIGIAFAVLTGLLLKYTLLGGRTEPFVMELPAYHLPTFRTVLLRAWNRLSSFIFKAGKFLVMVVVVLSFLNSWGTDGSFGHDNTEKSVLSAIGRSLHPVVEPMGIHEDNWPATVGLFTGIFAKEVVVGTLDTLYSQLESAEQAAEEGDGGTSSVGGIVSAGLSEAIGTIGPNLNDAFANLSDPLGLDIGDTSSTAAASEEQGVTEGVFGTMAQRFDGKIGAFAYLLMILLYVPCVAATAAILRETSVFWTTFISVWSTGLGYAAAVLTYQIGTFDQHPESSTVWIVSIIAACIAFIAGMAYLGKETRDQNSAIGQAIMPSGDMTTMAKAGRA